MNKFGFAAILVSVVMMATTVITTIINFDVRDQLKVEQAERATGACGKSKVIVLDKNRVAAAGIVMTPEALNTLRFDEADGGLRVSNRNGDILMERPPRR